MALLALLGLVSLQYVLAYILGYVITLVYGLLKIGKDKNSTVNFCMMVKEVARSWI